MLASRSLLKFLFCYGVVGILLPAWAWGQQDTLASQPAGCSGQMPGVYVRDGSGWDALTPSQPTKVKAKHGFASSLTYGAVAAPTVAVYPGTNAKVEVHGARPEICVYQMITQESPTLVRLHAKKDTRELDTGSMHASVTGTSHEAVASAGALVPTTTNASEGGLVITPQADLAPGEYAVMFGAQNLAIFDFGVMADK